MRHLHVLIPHLFGPLPAMRLPGFPQPAVLALRQWLSRAQVRPSAIGLSACLGQFFNLQKDDSAQDWPWAALSQVPMITGKYFLLASPVHLRPDRDQLVLFDAALLHITPAEATVLIQAINAHLQAVADPVQLHALSPQIWYWTLPQPPQLYTQELSRVIGQPIRAYLPTGEHAREWQRRLNEIQIVLHQHPLNQQRMQHHQPAINSLWLWGGGMEPCFKPHPPVTLWYSEQWREELKRLMTGIASRTQTIVQPLPADIFAGLGAVRTADSFILLDQLLWTIGYADEMAWVQQLEQWEQQYFQPLLCAVDQGIILHLTLYPCQGYCYTLSSGWRGRYARWRWPRWRTPRPLSHYYLINHG